MLLHSEDLVDESIAVKFSAMKSLAAWVNSDASNDYICCLAVKGSNFMGSHDRTDRDKVKSAAQNAAQLKQRYGKWKSYTKNDPILAADLHAIGKQGLSDLGYEPLRSLADDNQGTSDGYQCLLTPADCGITQKQYPKCKLQESTDFRGNGLRIDIEVSSSENPQECCDICRDSSKGCRYFTFDNSQKLCYMKSGSGEVVQGEQYRQFISGGILE